ncbi:hypothetical protein PsYK624_076270 [Phanerochaete sordida]|uniref:Uncharacterized protein n=1 Tax=Phanerochaete sordida TaxID=48140 RepID=A0A9P3G903_9APHY|nr:hypothetical protein PsYK624_076270 [Phanerochaete sordida]
MGPPFETITPLVRSTYSRRTGPRPVSSTAATHPPTKTQRPPSKPKPLQPPPPPKRGFRYKGQFVEVETFGTYSDTLMFVRTIFADLGDVENSAIQLFVNHKWEGDGGIERVRIGESAWEILRGDVAGSVEVEVV